MKNILVYITILIMIMPSTKLSADITMGTNNPFTKNNSPFNNNTPFVGNTPQNIERNLFAPKNIQTQHRRINFNQNKQRNNGASYLNSEVTYKSKGSFGGNTVGGGTTLRRYNNPTNYSENNVTAVYSMSARLKVTEINEAFATNEENTITNPQNPYEGAGAPSTYAPIGDAFSLLILLAALYTFILYRKQQ